MLAPEKLTLVAITDDMRGDAADLIARAQAATRGGATMIQLRLKDADARTLVEVARALIASLPRDVPLIVNDRADVAIAAGAAGVHVGAEDVLPAALRRVMPSDFIIGASVGTDADVPLANWLRIPAFFSRRTGLAGKCPVFQPTQRRRGWRLRSNLSHCAICHRGRICAERSHGRLASDRHS